MLQPGIPWSNNKNSLSWNLNFFHNLDIKITNLYSSVPHDFLGIFKLAYFKICTMINVVFITPSYNFFSIKHIFVWKTTKIILKMLGFEKCTFIKIPPNFVRRSPCRNIETIIPWCNSNLIDKMHAVPLMFNENTLFRVSHLNNKISMSRACFNPKLIVQTIHIGTGDMIWLQQMGHLNTTAKHSFILTFLHRHSYLFFVSRIPMHSSCHRHTQ